MKTLLFLVIFSIGPVLAASASRDIIKISTAIVDDVADSGEREFIIPANSTNTVIVQFGIKFYHLDKTNTYRGPHCHNYNPPLEQKYRCKAWREYSDEISIDISKSGIAQSGEDIKIKLSLQYSKRMDDGDNHSLNLELLNNDQREIIKNKWYQHKDYKIILKDATNLKINQDSIIKNVDNDDSEESDYFTSAQGDM